MWNSEYISKLEYCSSFQNCWKVPCSWIIKIQLRKYSAARSIICMTVLGIIEVVRLHHWLVNSPWYVNHHVRAAMGRENQTTFKNISFFLRSNIHKGIPISIFRTPVETLSFTCSTVIIFAIVSTLSNRPIWIISSMTSSNKCLPLSPNVSELVNVRKTSYVIIQSGVLFAWLISAYIIFSVSDNICLKIILIIMNIMCMGPVDNMFYNNYYSIIQMPGIIW